MPNWKKLSRDSKNLQSEIQSILNDWKKDNPDWTADIVFTDYPPIFTGYFSIYHIKNLSDKRLGELGILTTSICTKCGLLGKKIYEPRTPNRNNSVKYKFWLPIK